MANWACARSYLQSIPEKTWINLSSPIQPFPGALNGATSSEYMEYHGASSSPPTANLNMDGSLWLSWNMDDGRNSAVCMYVWQTGNSCACNRRIILQTSS